MSNDEPNQTTIPLPSLHSLDGQVVPAHIAADIQKVRDLPEKARQRFWEILGPNLNDPIPERIGEQVSRFCKAVGITEAQLAPPVRASRFLIRRAAAEDLKRELFAEDLVRLAGDQAWLAEVLLPGYEAGKKIVRDEMVQETLAAHGKLLETVDWRIDVITASSRGKNLRVPVVHLTLSYREGNRTERITLQLLPEAMKTLKQLWDRLVPR